MNPAAMKRSSLLLTAFAALSAPLHADVVVDFGAVNYTNSGAPFGRSAINNEIGDLDGDGAADDVRDVIPFSDTAALSPASAWNGTGANAIFHGGLQIVRLNAAAVTPAAAFTTTLNQNDPVPDRVRIGVNTAPGEAIDLISGVLVWTKPGFLEGFSTQRAAFAGSAADGLSVWLNNVTNASLRFVLRQGSDYYVSESTYGGAFAAGLLISLNGDSLGNERWAPWNPQDLRFTGTSFVPMDFDDITAVGLYFESTRAGTPLLPAGQNFNLTLDSLVLGAGPPPPTATLTLSAANGSILADPALDAYPIPSDVTLAAFPASGYVFTGWSGALTGYLNPATLRLDTDASVAASFAPVSTYAGWIVANWGPGPVASDLTDPAADPDADGLNNLLEFALGLDPTEATGPDLRPRLEFDEDRHLVLVYPRPAGLAGISYAADGSDDGVVWSALDSPEQTSPLPGGREEVRVRDDQPAPSQTRRHLRLRVAMGSAERTYVLSGQYLNVLAYEGFAYPVGLELGGAGTSGDGWLEGWRRTEASGQPLHVQASDALAAPVPLARNGGVLAQFDSQPGDNHIYRRAIEEQPSAFEPGDVVWFSLLVRSDQADTALGIRFVSADGIAFGLALKNGVIRSALADRLSADSLPLALGTPALLVGRLHLGAPQATLQVWNVAELSAPPAADDGVAVSAEVVVTSPHDLELVSTRWKGSFALDEFRLGDSFEAVAPAAVP